MLNSTTEYCTQQDIEPESKSEAYVVDKVIARRFNNLQNCIEYRIIWKNYDIKDNTWEPLYRLIEDNCFDPVFGYENLKLEEKQKVLLEYKNLDTKLKTITNKMLEKTENNPEIMEFMDDFIDFNPDYKEFFKESEFGNLLNDEIDNIFPVQLTKHMYLKVFWKKRKGETKPRKERIYPIRVIRATEIENFKKAFTNF